MPLRPGTSHTAATAATTDACVRAQAYARMVQEDALESASPRPLARLDESAESALAEMIEQQVPSAKPVLPLAISCGTYK